MATAVIDGIATRYEVVGSGPPLLTILAYVAPMSWAAAWDAARSRRLASPIRRQR